MKGTLAQRNYGPSNTSEMQRIIELPRRRLNLADVRDLTPAFRKPGGTMTLRPIQSAALWEMEKANGLFGSIGVGHGKTLCAYLASEVLNSRRSVLLCPPALRDHYIRAFDDYGRHFDVRVTPELVTYADLSRADKSAVLNRMAPDLIIADEAHHLRHKSSSRTKRVLRYFKQYPDTRFVALSGTMTSKSLLEYAHLLVLALKDGAPIPAPYYELQSWAEAIDVSPFPAPAGALYKLCKEHEHDLGIRNNGDRLRASGDGLHLVGRGQATEERSTGQGEGVGAQLSPARTAFRCRLVSTPGVVATEEGSIGTSLVIQARRPEVPTEVEEALEELRQTWTIGDIEISDALMFHRYTKQLACGFYYKWDWPNGEVDNEWLEARSAWAREVRNYLTYRSREGCDSEYLYTQRVLDGSIESRAWGEWALVASRPEPPTVAVWLSDFLVKDAVEWGKEGGLIWYKHHALGIAIAEMGDYPLCAGGADGSFLLAAMAPEFPTMVLSVNAHKEGVNLQDWNRNLYTSVVNGAAFEQSLGRTHRAGQLADEVTADVYLHTAELEKAFSAALEDAAYIEQTQGQKQKLLYGTVLR